MGVKYSLDGDSKGAVKAVNDFKAALDSAGNSAGEAVRSAKSLTAEAKRLAEQADPTVKYVNQIKNLAEHVKAGRLEMGQAETLAVRYRTALKSVGDTSKEAFAVSHIKGFLGEIGVTLSAVTLLVKGLKQVEAAVERSREQTAGAAKSTGKLRQLAPDQATFSKLKGQRDQLFASGAVASLDEAASTIFDLAKAGQNDPESLATLGKLADKGILDIRGAAGATGRITEGFGKGETGNTNAILAKAFRAQKFGRGSVDDLLSAVGAGSASARRAGIGDEELFGATAVLSKEKDAGAAGADITAFLTGAGRGELGDLKGLSLVDRVEKIKGLNLDPARLKKALGSRAAVRGFRELSDRVGDIRTATDSVNQPLPLGGLDASIKDRLAISDPSSELAGGLQREKNVSVLAQEPEAQFKSLLLQYRERRDREIIANRPRALAALQLGAQGYIADALADKIVNPELQLQSIANAGFTQPKENRMTEAEIKQLEELKKQSASLDAMDNRSKSRGSVRPE